MAFRRDYEITIKADMSDMPYWTCKRKGELCSYAKMGCFVNSKVTIWGYLMQKDKKKHKKLR
jgi:hypothetical protein